MSFDFCSSLKDGFSRDDFKYRLQRFRSKEEKKRLILDFRFLGEVDRFDFDKISDYIQT